MSDRVYESMTRMRAGTYTVRVWRTESHLASYYDNGDLCGVVGDWLESGDNRPYYLAEVLADMPRVAAVEITDSDGDGVVIYNDWP